MTLRKIKVHDVDTLRSELDALYEKQSHIVVARWSLTVADRIMEITDLDRAMYPEIAQGFSVNKEWQRDAARMHDVRQAGFAIHKIARSQHDEITKNVFRVVGQAVASGHMREHAMVTSDYAIKVINLLFPGDIDRVTEERNWQITSLREIAVQAPPRT